MKKMILYDIEAVGKYLYKVPFNAVALVPSDVDGKLKMIPTSSVLIKGQSFNSRRDEIRDLGPGCDMYFALDSEDNITPEMRDELKLSKTIINMEDNGLVTILDKKIIDLNIELLSKEELKELRKMGINHTRLNNNDINKLESSKLKYILSPDYLSISHLTNAGKEVVTLDELLSAEDNIEYEEGKVKTESYNESSDKIVSFYEYDIETESIPPFGGEPYEFEQVARSTDGKPVWFATPDIVRNRNREEHARRVYEKGNRTLVKIPEGKEGIRIRKALELYDPERICEFVEFNNMGKDYLIETNLDKALESQESKGLSK